MIQKRRSQLDALRPEQDLLSFLLLLRDEDGQPAFTDAQIRNETLSLLIAGHENATSLLCWTWYLLAQHPAVAERVFSEVATQLQGRTPTLTDLPQLPYIRMVLEESLRLYPPAWSFPRRALAADVIGGYAIPAGAAVLLSPYTTHRHPDFWRDPEVFDPERFSEAAEANRPRYAHFPFGGGQHQCMGATFAMMEAHLVMAMLAQRYRLELVPGFTVHPEPLVTLRPQELSMRLHPAP
jgi:cytochrome P450